MKIEKLGTVLLTTGELTITDPCYDKGTWCTANLKNVFKGLWEASLEFTDCGSWGTRVSALHFNAVGQTGGFFKKTKDEIGVDAGVCGIFENKPNYTDDDWDNLNFWPARGGMAKLTNGFRCNGCWSHSGLGDGGYRAAISKNSDGQIVGIKVIYLED